MRKLKLQMQMTINGFVGGPNGELDWMEWNWGEDIKKYVNDLTDSVDTILLGRKMTDGFIAHWTNVVKKRTDDESYLFAKKMVDKPKIVFTKILDESNPVVSGWENTSLAKGDIRQEVGQAKKQKSDKDIVVYGGAGFVSSLVENNLIDEYHLFVNPNAIGEGLTIFKERTNLKLVKSVQFDCGIVLLNYILK